VTVTVKDPQFFAPTATVTLEPSGLTAQVIGQPELLLTVQVAPGQGGSMLPPQTVPGFAVSAPVITISSEQQTGHLILKVLQSLQSPAAEETHTVTSCPSLSPSAFHFIPGGVVLIIVPADIDQERKASSKLAAWQPETTWIVVN